MALAQVTLEDKYVREEGRIYLTGTQALVRLPMMQKRRDTAAGLNTGGFISGYRGSPLGLYDSALWAARPFLERHRIHFQPGVNEDLAATAVWGSQQVGLFPGAEVDGVFAIWYGKGPGVDRSMDVFKHGNAAGTSKDGGVLVLMGDDHGCASSTLAHQSEQMLSAAMIPVFNPATVQEYLEYGLAGWALSRFSGCWVGLKTISETVESSASVVVPQRSFLAPTDFEMPPGGLGIRWPDPPLDQEKRLHTVKMAAVAAWVRQNPLDRIAFGKKPARLGLVTMGKAHLDVRQALSLLGIDEARAAALGLVVQKLGVTWPIDAEGIRSFASGLEELFVVEEKRAFVEEQIGRALFNMPAAERPRLIGKTDEAGRRLLHSEGELSPVEVARAIAERLLKLRDDPDLRRAMMRLSVLEGRGAAAPVPVARTPFFCSGCPHNTSTQVPEGSRAVAGIGCHSMAIWMPRRTALWTHMGGEGANWIGQAPFTKEKHIFQNLGDGTYFHSGLMAIRASAAAGTNITYKILFNDAVAMTGGQPIDGQLTVPEIARQVAAEGAKKIVVVTDDPEKYPVGAGFPAGTDIRHRSELDATQRELREIPGLTILIYDQTCAAEKRRRRKRGTFPDPERRVFINDRVCEACGDCSKTSNCVSVKPLETELGRKRFIDQSSCNKDFSCVEGFCPSFVSVYGAERRKAAPTGRGIDPAEGLPLPTPTALERPYDILVTGIGGTGVITVGALLGMAAHLEGKGTTVLDSTGLAQKNGAVMSHLRIAPKPEDLHAVRIAAGEADLVLGCDMVVAASPAALQTYDPERTRAAVNGAVEPTAAFVLDRDANLRETELRRAISGAAKETEFVNAAALATAILGDAIASNLFLVGFAFQKGWIPLSLEAIERAIDLNGIAVAQNRRAFAWGRKAAHDPAAVEAQATPVLRLPQRPPANLPELVEKRAKFLAEYQDEAYARRYRSLVAEVEAAEREKAKGFTGLARAAAENLFKLMAYKDEYEVARLYTDGGFEESLRKTFDGDFRIEFHLAPPIFGDAKKRTFGPWMLRVFKALAKLKHLRGTKLDIFGRTEERRMERRLIEEYETLLREIVQKLSPENHGTAVALANVPQDMRGFGHIKRDAVEKAKKREAELLAAFRSPAPLPAAVAAE